MSIADRAVDIALGEVGKPYHEHRDCSGFTAWVARQVGVTIPEGSVAQYSVGTRVSDYSHEPGLLHFWDTYGAAPGHVAIGVGNGRIVHAINESAGIVTSSLSPTVNMGGNGRYMGARRIFSSEPHLPAQPAPETPPKVQKPRDRQRTREQDRTRRRRRKA